MATRPLDPKQQRTQTDTSLRAERLKSDQVIAAHQVDVANDEDEVLRRARHQADAVLATARGKADALEDDGKPNAAIATERRQEDKILRDERRAADLARRRERAMLNAMLPRDRETTDLHLLTERTRSDEALVELDDFMGLVSHDLRNLLNSIVLNAAVVADIAAETGAGRKAADSMSRIRVSVVRMNRLIGDVIDIASIDAGSFVLVPHEANIVAIAHEAIDALAAVAAEKRVTLKLQAASTSVVAVFDVARVLQVLISLINNAVKFTASGGEVVVDVAGDDAVVAVVVRDTGIGIPPTELERIFERFAKGARHATPGIGLGLYLSRCIVEAHGGWIHATSEAGAGSAVHVELPTKATPPR